jgi:hypothetical protein
MPRGKDYTGACMKVYASHPFINRSQMGTIVGDNIIKVQTTDTVLLFAFAGQEYV